MRSNLETILIFFIFEIGSHGSLEMPQGWVGGGLPVAIF